MAVKTIAELKAMFESGDKPTQSNFEDLIDTLFNQSGSQGTYTPTLTNVLNATASTAYLCNYSRVGDYVTVSGSVDVDITLSGNTTRISMTLPIASNFGSYLDASGTGVCAATGECAGIYGDSTNDYVVLDFLSSTTSNNTFYFTFGYSVI